MLHAAPDIKVFHHSLVGLSSDVEYVKEIFPNALILEDVCESHGVRVQMGRNVALIVSDPPSVFTSVIITTIEGGMISPTIRTS